MTDRKEDRNEGKKIGGTEGRNKEKEKREKEINKKRQRKKEQLNIIWVIPENPEQKSTSEMELSLLHSISMQRIMHLCIYKQVDMPISTHKRQKLTMLMHKRSK